jgi:hypothetical protein
VLRELARAAGCHIWLNTPDVLVAGPHSLMLHAASPGRKTLSIPPNAVLADQENGSKYRGTAAFNVQFGETKLFLIQRPAEQYR